MFYLPRLQPAKGITDTHEVGTESVADLKKKKKSSCLEGRKTLHWGKKVRKKKVC